MGDPSDVPALRQLVLAVSVLFDLDVEPHDRGVVLPAAGLVGWTAIQHAAGAYAADADAARARLAEWLWLREQVATLPLEVMEASARVVGMPLDASLHPGAEWVREHVRGGALDLGLGLLGLDPAHPETVVPIAESVLRDAGIYADSWWAGSRRRLEDMGALAAERRQRDRTAALRPMGDADVVTLLGSRALRAQLAGEQADGMATVVVPLRTRGWSPAGRVDPAFGPAAAAIAEPADRGFSRPLLVTADELALAIGDPRRAIEQVARDLTGDVSGWERPVAPRQP